MADTIPGLDTPDPMMDPSMMGEPPAEDTLDSGPETPLEDSIEEPPLEPVEETNTEDIEEALNALVEHYDSREESVRITRARILKLLDYYWQGIQNVFWNEAGTDYTPITESDLNDNEELPKIINIYKAYGESIIAALSNATPKVRYFPQDADKHDDILTAKTFSSLSKMIEKENGSEMMLMKAMFNLYNGGIVAANITTEDDYSKPKIQRPKMGTQTDISLEPICPECGSPMPMPPPSEDPNQPEMPPQCETCGYSGEPIMDEKETVSEKIESIEEIVRKKVTINLWGPLHFFVPSHVRKQCDTPYLGLDYEEDEAKAKMEHDHIADKIVGTNASNSYLRWTRLTSLHIDQSNSALCTIRKRWYRPCAFYSLNEDQRDLLLGLYPKGVYLCKVDEVLAEYNEADLDDDWVLSENPLYNDIYGQPQGRGLLDIQDMVTMVVNLTKDTIEQGIGITFASPTVLDFDKFSKSRARPGDVFPTKASLGEDIGKGFYQTKTATLSDEVNMFDRRLEQYGQFACGAYPSIYGGVIQGGGGTASEYESSKNASLQRLQIMWRVVGNWWARMMQKATYRYIKEMEDDVAFVQKSGNTFLNVWIKMAEAQGSIGRVEPEYNEQFPMSWGQKKDVIQNLLTMGNDAINEILQRPENAGLIADILGLTELFVPGQEDRNKQLWEISQFVKGIPIEPEMMVDAHDVHVLVLLEYMNGEYGIALKSTQPQIYDIMNQHLMAHMQMGPQAEMMKQQMQAAAMPPGQSPNGQPPDQGQPPPMDQSQQPPPQGA
jgi:hypothetical protein